MLPSQIIGVFCTLSAVAFGLVVGLIIKVLSDDLSLLTTLFYRFLFCLPIILGVALWARGGDFLKLKQKKTMLFRIVFGLIGILLWFLALRNISFGQATALFQSSVLFVTLASPLILSERVGPFRMSAVLVGMVGIVMLTDPFSAPLTKGILYAVAGAVVHAGLSLSLRRLGKRDEPVTIALLHNLAGFVIWSSCFLVFPDQWQIPVGQQWTLLILLGVITSLLQLSFTFAYKFSDAVVVVTLRYLQVPTAGILGFILFSEVPTFVQVGGAMIVVTSCMFIVWREFVISREQGV
tara:strand:+ start:1894 stop:2775 length:882 start_codon:yes stop_codon:yes gene_type:complete